MDFDALVVRYQELTRQREELTGRLEELTERRQEVARALVRKGPFTETPLSAKQREQREQASLLSETPPELGTSETA